MKEQPLKEHSFADHMKDHDAHHMSKWEDKEIASMDQVDEKLAEDDRATADKQDLAEGEEKAPAKVEDKETKVAAN